jgi:hypothetical protein
VSWSIALPSKFSVQNLDGFGCLKALLHSSLRSSIASVDHHSAPFRSRNHLVLDLYVSTQIK